MKSIACEGLTVRYGRRLALDGVSFEVPAGSVYALLGRNGAGKSSLIRCLLGEQKPSAGSARLMGRDPWRQRAAILREVGVVAEEPDMPPEMSARQLSRFCARLYPAWDQAGLAARLQRFGVPLDQQFRRLSRGQKAQVSLALALACVPRLLVLDDPTLGLDAVARRAVFEELIGELADRGTTVLITSHDLEGIERIADRVGILRGGRLVLDEEMESLKRRFRRLGLGSEQAAAELASLQPVAVANRAWGVEAVVGNFDELSYPAGGPGGEIDVSALTLEEIFVAVSGDTREVFP